MHNHTVKATGLMGKMGLGGVQHSKLVTDTEKEKEPNKTASYLY